MATLKYQDFPSKPFGRYVTRRLDRYVEPTLFTGTTAGERKFLAPLPEDELLRNLDGYRDAGVAYVLRPAGQALRTRTADLRLVARTPSTWIYRLADPAPYFGAGPGCAVRAHDRRHATVTCRGPSELVRRETEVPGWTARVDGREVPIRRRDELFQAVPVGPGRHQVSFDYAPPGAVWGLVGVIAGAAWLAGAALLRRRARLSASGASAGGDEGGLEGRAPRPVEA